MKNIVDISCFSSGKRLEMRVFDGLRAGLGSQCKLLIVIGMGWHLRVFGRLRQMKTALRENSTAR